MANRLGHNGPALSDVQFSWRAEQRALLYDVVLFLPSLNIPICSPVPPQVCIVALTAPLVPILVNALRGPAGSCAESPRLLPKGALLPFIRARLPRSPAVRPKERDEHTSRVFQLWVGREVGGTAFYDLPQRRQRV